jgi:uncharacterized protein (TIGR02996 family)
MPMLRNLLSGERQLFSAVVDDLSDDDRKLVYSDWLEERGDRRGNFLRAFVAASRSMKPADFPAPDGIEEEWLELIGFRIVEQMSIAGCLRLNESLLKIARPALRMNDKPAAARLPVGASKIGGEPDLPPDLPWPIGDQCRAIYNDDTAGVDKLAGFLGQVNFAEISTTQAARRLPKEGVLSFFSYQDLENDHPDQIGAMAVYFPNAAILAPRKSPEALTEGNREMRLQSLTFEETLDLPGYENPFRTAVELDARCDDVIDHFRTANFYNMLGFARATTGTDPTPSKDWQHLIIVSNSGGCRLHLQLKAEDLVAGKFDRIALVWVDFD